MKGPVKLVFAGMMLAGMAGCVYREPARPYDPMEDYYDSIYGEGVGRKILYEESEFTNSREEKVIDEKKGD